MNIDRKDIVPFFGEWFPQMRKASSEEWNFFLDELTGVETPLTMPNAQAFDRWRMELAKQGYPAFPYSQDDLQGMKAKASAALKAEQDRAAAVGKTLADLAKEAPNWPVSKMLEGD
jgi:hypothetical protein